MRFETQPVARSSDLGSFEQLVLLALVRGAPHAYGASVRRELVERTGRDVSLGAVYATLERLEGKGFVRSREARGDAERGGRARRFFEITASGHRTLTETLRVLDELRRVAPHPDLHPRLA